MDRRVLKQVIAGFESGGVCTANGLGTMYHERQEELRARGYRVAVIGHCTYVTRPGEKSAEAAAAELRELMEGGS